MSKKSNPFAGADIIHTYTRKQGIDDGELVDLSAQFPDLVREVGIKFPVACTATVYAQCIALTECAKRMGNDIKGRAWDVLWMLSCAIRGGKGGSRIQYKLNVVGEQPRATEVTLVAVCGPGDTAAPVITIMYPGED